MRTGRVEHRLLVDVPDVVLEGGSDPKDLRRYQLLRAHRHGGVRIRSAAAVKVVGST